MTTTTNATAQTTIRLLERIIQEITLNPGKTRIVAKPLGLSSTEVVIHADAMDYGKILGGKGQHFQGMKTICKLISDRTGREIELVLADRPAATSPIQQMPEFQTSEDWPRERIQNLVQDIVTLCLSEDNFVQVTDGSHAKSVIDAVVGDSAKASSAAWLKDRMQPLIKAIGLKNGRILSINIVHDEETLANLRQEVGVAA